MANPKYIPEHPFSDDEIEKIEEAYGHKVPQDYREFVQKYGSTLVGGELDGSPEYGVLHFFGVYRDVGVLTDEGEYEEFRAEGMLPIARCVMGNIYFIDLKEGNTVHYIDYCGGRTTVEKVAESFQEFVDRIVIVNEDEEEEG